MTKLLHRIFGQLTVWPADSTPARFDYWRDGDAHWLRIGRRTFVYDTPATMRRYA